MTTFSDAPWDGGAENYKSAEEYCSASLIDENPAGKPKVKALCHLPIRAPGSDAVNKAALGAAKAALAGARGHTVQASPASKKAAAAKIDRLEREAKMGKYAKAK